MYKIIYAFITEVFIQNNLSHLAKVFSPKVFRQITGPRSKHGTYLHCAGILALTFLGLLAGQNYLIHIRLPNGFSMKTATSCRCSTSSFTT